MKLPLDYTSRTFEARPLVQGKPGLPDYVSLNILLGTSFVQCCTPRLVYASKIEEMTYPHRVWNKDTFSNSQQLELESIVRSSDPNCCDSSLVFT